MYRIYFRINDRYQDDKYYYMVYETYQVSRHSYTKLSILNFPVRITVIVATSTETKLSSNHHHDTP